MSNTRLTTFALAVAALLYFTSTPTAWSQKREMKETMIGGHTMYTLLKPGDIPAIFSPTFLSANDSIARQLHDPDEPMMAVSVGAESRAYSTKFLDHHEIVNDEIGGTAIAVTW